MLKNLEIVSLEERTQARHFVKHVAEMHGGRVQVRSELGKGAVLILFCQLARRCNTSPITKLQSSNENLTCLIYFNRSNLMEDGIMKHWLSGLFVLATLISCTKSKQQDTVKIDGSSTVFPVTEAIAEKFREISPNVRVKVGMSGTAEDLKNSQSEI